MTYKGEVAKGGGTSIICMDLVNLQGDEMIDIEDLPTQGVGVDGGWQSRTRTRTLNSSMFLDIKRILECTSLLWSSESETESKQQTHKQHLVGGEVELWYLLQYVSLERT